MKKLLFSFALTIVLGATWVVFIAVREPNRDFLAIGSFIVLTLTLVALMVYAYDTNTMARISREQWKRESVLTTTYSMQVVTEEANSNGQTLFDITNPSTLLVRAQVRANFRVYGQPVDYHDDFNGNKTWYVFPLQTNRGWFDVQSLLEKQGKYITAMKNETSTNNRYEQLTMDLEIEFRDELGNTRVLPSRKHFFDFSEWRWVPIFTQKDDWS